jgi:two-component system response regulator NreC
LTLRQEASDVVRALHAGIKGYVLKTQAASDLMQAIREVSQGALYLSSVISRVVVDAYLAKKEIPPDPLTQRQREVLQLIAEGKTTKEIAELLGTSFKTAESHRARIMRKLEIHQTAGLVRYAIRQRLIQA